MYCLLRKTLWHSTTDLSFFYQIDASSLVERCDCNFFCRAKKGELSWNQTCVETPLGNRLEKQMKCLTNGCAEQPCISCERIAAAKFDPKKPVVAILADGSKRAARIICTDAKGPWPIIALTDWGPKDNETFVEHSWMFDAQGNHVGKRGMHLVNVKVKKWKWVVDANGYISIIGPYSENEWQKEERHYGHIFGRIQESLIEE